MGKRKKSSRGPVGPKKVRASAHHPKQIHHPRLARRRRRRRRRRREEQNKAKKQGPTQREALATTFQCLFCNHEKSVTVKLERKLGVGQLLCKVCGQTFQTNINYLSAAVDVYADWVDACDAVAKENADATSKDGPLALGRQGGLLSRQGGGGGGGGGAAAAAGGGGATARDDGDGFIVDDEMDAEGDFGDEE
ncbi:Elf1-domain-containing protein [Pseudovirgaria hyperparasitica]|uniref:Transcription elongation factor 1 homolog n=1 Tax=Pseudovirgaria hyperparasitica TaxID=470096 RepID=A0A6A6W1T1_9PEZI|nr:Elf1-domain-containing protein [Pseudovirgaria hyperparasitica]KAF2756036.1 Elf1-domain-containing protein [Pseudovirgaria hyperparasitica]